MQSTKATGLLKLMRPANIVTAVADVLAGIAISGFFTGWLVDPVNISLVVWLCISTAGLYGGGVVFNDFFDAELDKRERPERPIPSGTVNRTEAGITGSLFLLIGIAAAFRVDHTAGFLAVAIAVLALVYDKWAKHHGLAGPLNMGVCRGLNLLLGMSIVPASLNTWWLIACVPVIYIASITMISRGEVHGGNKNSLYIASFLYALVLGGMIYFARYKGTLLFAVLFLTIFAWMIYQPLFRAMEDPAGKNIGRAVKAGVIALIMMDSAWAAAAGALDAALVIVLLLPLSFWLAEKFAVT